MEDHLVLGHDLGRVGVAQGSHEQLLLAHVWVLAAEDAGHVQDRLDGAQAPLVMVLLGEELLEEIVKAVELGGQDLGLVVPENDGEGRRRGKVRRQAVAGEAHGRGQQSSSSNSPAPRTRTP